MNQQIRPGSFSLLPVVVKNLLILNGLFFLATLVFADRFQINLTAILGLRFPLSEEFRPHQLITYMFMHQIVDHNHQIVFSHILMNMFALWMFGSVLENHWGSKRFLVYYIVTGIGAAICHYTVVYIQLEPYISFMNHYIENPSLNTLAHNNVLGDLRGEFKDYLSQQHISSSLSQQELTHYSVEFMERIRSIIYNAPVIVGASGSVFGILLAFGILFSNTPVMLFPLPISIKAKFFVLLFGITELYQIYVNNPNDNVAHFAHLGGMLFGFVLIKYWQKNSKHFY